MRITGLRSAVLPRKSKGLITARCFWQDSFKCVHVTSWQTSHSPETFFKLWFSLRLHTPHDHCWNFVPQDAPETRFATRVFGEPFISYGLCLFVFFLLSIHTASSLEIVLFGGPVSKFVLRGQDQNLRSADGKKKFARVPSKINSCHPKPNN